MSSTCDPVSDHRLCYVHCNYCNTILAVSVPCSNFLKVVTVRCGQCTQLLSVNMGTALNPLAPLQPEQPQNISYEHRKDLTSSSTSCEKATTSMHTAKDKAKIICRGTPEKRTQRMPSAYNRFIKEEIQRIKARNPDIRHREAFSTAAKNWAHFPSMHFGTMAEKNNKADVDKVFNYSERASKYNLQDHIEVFIAEVL